jgi:hypothetical protein
MMDECTNSMAPGAEELLRLVLDKEPLRQEVREHLEQCSTCQQQLAVYMRTPDQLLSKLYRSECPSVTRLNLYCASMLSGDEGLGIAYHIAECPLCTREVITIRQFLADFEPFPMLEEKVAGRIVERIVAAFVPWKPQLVTRGAASDGLWPRQYRAGELNVSLHLSHGSSGETILLGLFTSDDPDEAIEEQEGVPVDLYPTLDFSVAQNVNEQTTSAMKQPVMTAKIDDLGNVVFKAVSAGEYVMVVHLPARDVVIEGLGL